MSQYKKIDLSKVRTVKLKRRKSKVDIGDFSKVLSKKSSFRSFVDSLPNILKASELRYLVDKIIQAKKKKKMVISMLGAHVIKCGLSPILINLMEKGIIKAVAMNGAGIIHDSEVAMVGRTSEDVSLAIENGTFGMAEETASFVNGTINEGFKSGLGIGEALGEAISNSRFPYKSLSILASGYNLKIPVTGHIAIGTDIIHQHPSANGEAIGEGSLIDFRNFIYSVSKLEGGVAINFGSAVILPEVFLKSITVARNLGHKVRNFTTANFDMIAHYRPYQNVLLRPTSLGGRGINIIGHHEIMIPLLYRMIIDRL